VRPATRSPRAKAKALTKRTADGLPVHSFRTLLADLATPSKHTVQPRAPGVPTFERLALPTAPQRRALELLGIPLTPQ
jgi:hypothetical protein